jgi:hypothetical protein
MRKLMLTIVLLLVAAIGFAQVDSIHYRDTATLQWDPVTTDASGEPLLPGDTITYEVYVYDYYGGGVTDDQDVTQLTPAGTTVVASIDLDFSGLPRAAYAAGVRTVGTDGQGVTTYSAIAWSYDPVATDPMTPFFYVPLGGVLILPAPTGLQDAGM